MSLDKSKIRKQPDAMSASRYSAKNIIPEGIGIEKLNTKVNAHVIFRTHKEVWVRQSKLIHIHKWDERTTPPGMLKGFMVSCLFTFASCMLIIWLLVENLGLSKGLQAGCVLDLNDTTSFVKSHRDECPAELYLVQFAS